MRKIKVGSAAQIAGIMAIAAALAGGASARTLPKITGKPGHGCPYGAVCVYPRGFSFKPGPEKKHGIFYSYGAHNLYHQYGYHLVYNNQYNVNGVAAGVTLCMGYNGKGSEFGGGDHERARVVGAREPDPGQLDHPLAVQPHVLPLCQLRVTGAGLGLADRNIRRTVSSRH